ncbi:hypothetical protein NEOKW01_1881 [Nematocida sp. AWRm80]|nr:hypothetical protein NEOKW01_1881 [Nematocida sp. AWRm80]
MYFKNRSTIDRIGLGISYSLLGYFGLISTPLILWKDIPHTRVYRWLVVLLNVSMCSTFGLLMLVSGTRGYLKEEEYKSGGKFCYECRQAKAERAHHCSRCRRCITKMDHHCPWIGACVNGHNFGNFTKLVAIGDFTSFLGLWLYSYAFLRRVRVYTAGFNVDIFLFISAMNILLLLLATVGLSVLFARQISLIYKNMTYLESLQVRKLNQLQISYPPNPYNKGLLGNLKEIFGTPLEFFLCQVPKKQKENRYINYWPPLRMTKSGTIRNTPVRESTTS